MKLSTRTRYGVRALLEMALHQGKGLVLLKDIAREQEISLPYLEHLIAPLVAVGMVHSTKGPHGGVSLARETAEIKLSEIVGLLEGSTAPVACVNDPAVCPRSGSCVTRDVWVQLKEVMDNVLGATTLKDLVERQREKARNDPSMYYI
jgi:Rrf2 family cysteine metabolism transcriptional repressor